MQHKEKKCSMKDILEENGFKSESNEEVWTKFNWTIRFSKDEMEAFNNPLYNIIGKYHKCDITDENLKNTIEDINTFIEEGI